MGLQPGADGQRVRPAISGAEQRRPGDRAARPAQDRLDVGQRVIADRGGASSSTTFLGAPVEVVEECRVPRGVEGRIEDLLHRVFAPARVDAWFERDGRTVAEAHEWFAVPFGVIDEAVGLIERGDRRLRVRPASRSLRLGR